MKKKIKKTRKTKKTPAVFTGSEVGALIESFRGDVQLVAENQVETNRKVDNLAKKFESFKVSTEENFKFVGEQFMRIDERFDGIENRLDGLEAQLEDIKDRLNFIETDIKDIKKSLGQKAEKKWVEKRILFLERELAELKAIVAKV